MRHTFALGSSELTGRVPSEIGLMTKFTASLNFQKASLSGPLPSELGSLTGIKWSLNLFNNYFSQAVPSEVGRMSVISSGFNIQFNELSRVPSQIGMIVVLKWFDLDLHFILHVTPFLFPGSMTRLKKNLDL